MRRNRDRLWSFLVLLPSLILVGVFVYGFIGNTVYVSMTDWGSGAALAADPELKFIGGKHYGELFTGMLDSRFRQSLVNAFFYSLFLIVGTIAVGLLIAVLLDRQPKGEGTFRTLFLYPMSLSFIVSGTIWRWLEAPSGGLNLLPTLFGAEPAQFKWLSSRQTILQFNWQNLPQVIIGIAAIVVLIVAIAAWRNDQHRKSGILGSIGVIGLVSVIAFGNLFPDIIATEEMHGFNLATAGVIIAAIWQYSGYTMALYLAGLGGISSELHDSARIDGANELQYYLRVAIPLLKTTTLSAMVILAHVSLKLFALIFAMTGPDNAETGHPAVLMYLVTFRANNFAKGAAISVVLFLLASLFIIPYLIGAHRERRYR